MFSRLELTNFTVFKKLELELSPGINVLVGANGTGKTHILKILYCLQTTNNFPRSLVVELGSVFQSKNGDLSRLVRYGSVFIKSKIIAIWNKEKWDISLDNKHGAYPYTSGSEYMSDLHCPKHHDNEDPVFIPVKEPLSFAPGFISLYDKYHMSFDKTYYDILKSAFLPRIRNVDPALQEILSEIQDIIGGEVVVEGETFYLELADDRLMEISLVAEGFRKLALVWQLIRNGSLCKGSTLYWDEPEANLNPFLMQHVAKTLIKLANHGVQVFLATHNYAFLKEIDHQKEQTPVTYFALDDSGENGVQANMCSEYINISPNKIAEENLRLYDMAITKAFKGNS